MGACRASKFSQWASSWAFLDSLAAESNHALPTRQIKPMSTGKLILSPFPYSKSLVKIGILEFLAKDQVRPSNFETATLVPEL
jgi:hypothetical protein